MFNERNKSLNFGRFLGKKQKRCGNEENEDNNEVV